MTTPAVQKALDDLTEATLAAKIANEAAHSARIASENAHHAQHLAEIKLRDAEKNLRTAIIENLTK